MNELKLELNGKKVWFFHGDVFDVVIQNFKWLAKLGAIGYGGLILLNTFVNMFAKLQKLKPVSFSKKIKQSVMGAVKMKRS
jgi:UDP-2,3-diacylglucosamine pyrophosphatase LpxH